MNPFKRSNSNKIHADNTTVVPLSDAAITAYTCPISMEIMIDPVITKEGYTYERSAIMEWLKTNNTCPLSRKPMTTRELVPNKNLRETIEKCRENGQLPKLVTPLSRRASCVWSSSVDLVVGGFRPPDQTHPVTSSHSELVVGGFRPPDQTSSRNGASEPYNQVIIPAMYNSYLLDPVDIPENPDFSFLAECDKKMIQSAYTIVSRLNKWNYMRRYEPSNQSGFVFDQDLIINGISGAIDIDYGGHSGSSMGYTMRRIQYIAQNGFEKFKEDYCRSNN